MIFFLKDNALTYMLQQYLHEFIEYCLFCAFFFK